MHLLKHPLRQALLLIFVLFGLILQSAFAMEQARTRLAVAAAKNLNALWALQLDDGKDTAATAYLTNAAEAGAEQTPLTFLNQDGKQQPLFRAQGDDIWRPDRYAQEALSYSKSHDRFPGHNLRGNITRSVWQGVTDQAGETGRAFGEQITTAPWATVKAVSGAMASGAWAVARHPLQSAENFGKEVLRLGKDAAFNLGSGTTSAWAGYRGAENPLNELYGQNMGPALLSLGSAQGVLTAAQAIPMMKGAQALGKGMQALGKGALQAGKTAGGKGLFQLGRGEGVASAGVSGKVIDVTLGNKDALPKLRQKYVDEVNRLKDLGLNASAAGADAESIARMLYAERNALKLKYRELTPIDKVRQFEQRNLKKYGNSLGPSIEQLRAAGKSWKDIIDSATRPGGADLGF